MAGKINIAKVYVHPHPIVEMSFDIDKDGDGLITITNKERNIVESNFFIDEERIDEIIKALKKLKKYLNQLQK